MMRWRSCSEVVIVVEEGEVGQKRKYDEKELKGLDLDEF